MRLPEMVRGAREGSRPPCSKIDHAPDAASGATHFAGAADGATRFKGVCGDLRRGAAWALIGLVRLYQLLLSPWLGGRCRHLPSCSAYAIEAFERFGPLGGGWLALKRLGRCHPWGSWGYDPVPERETAARCETASEYTRHCQEGG